MKHECGNCIHLYSKDIDVCAFCEHFKPVDVKDNWQSESDLIASLMQCKLTNSTCNGCKYHEFRPSDCLAKLHEDAIAEILEWHKNSVLVSVNGKETRV